jgi:hypothetical protein
MKVIFSDDNSIKMAEGKEPGNGKIVVSLGQMQSRVIESPQFGLILVKGLDQDPGRSYQIANYGSLFLRSRIFGVFRGNWL